MTIPSEMAFASLTSLGQKLRAGEFTSSELTEFFLERLARWGTSLNAVVTITADLAREEARRADSELKQGRDRGPLHGIPYGVKDLLATRGIPTSWGAAPLREQMIDGDATVLVRLREAGAVLAAKLSMVEIAGGFGYRQANASFTGPGRNPWDPSRWSGGSSSGPGSAVGAGLIPFAIGSETSGSIVTPSAYCGISGLRPTYGRVSRHGAMALSWTMDKLGPMCRTAADCGLVLNAIAGPDPEDPTCSTEPYQYPDDNPADLPLQLAGLKGAEEFVQPAIRENYLRSLELLADVVELQEIELPDLPYGLCVSTIIDCEMAAAFEGLVSSGDVWELTAEEDRYGSHAALLTPAVDYINALRIRGRIQRDLDRVFAPFTAIVTPTLPTVAGPISLPFREWRAGMRGTSLGVAANLAGLPAITVPNGFDEDGLPTAIQFTGGAFRENRIVQAAAMFQERSEWHLQIPKAEW